MAGRSSEDVLFAVRNALHLGAPQTAISEAAHLTGLNEDEKIMRDVLTHRAYIELGSSEVRPLWDHLSQVDLKTGTISS